MRKLVIACVALVGMAGVTRAHLCNDVFAQARDNLAVKVDIRDGQLRINQTGSFRVYLLNTMDRAIVEIQLEVESQQFEAEVKPSPTWKRFPHLETARNGGQKEYFEVSLKRKAGTADGKYQIGLKLTGGKNGKVFKTLDINDAMAVLKVPAKPRGLAIDGKAQKTEWADALLCDDLHQAGRDGGRFEENVPAKAPTRVRFAQDAANVYCMLSASDIGQKDEVRFHFAPDVDSKTRTVAVNLKTSQIAGEGAAGLVCRAVEGGGMEIQIPLAAVGLGGKRSFLFNVARERDGVVSCLSGTPSSSANPVAFPTFLLAN